MTFNDNGQPGYSRAYEIKSVLSHGILNGSYTMRFAMAIWTSKHLEVNANQLRPISCESTNRCRLCDAKGHDMGVSNTGPLTLGDGAFSGTG